MEAPRNVRNDPDGVGARSRAEVERSLSALSDRVGTHQTQTQFYRGVLSGHLWALGRSDTAPITGAHGLGPPSMAHLTAEVDAATVQLQDQSLRTVARDYVQGAHDTLVWICGYSNDGP